MDNPLLKTVIANYPGVDPASLIWPDGANEWTQSDLELFLGSGGFLKPKAKKKPAPANGGYVAAPDAKSPDSDAKMPASEGNTAKVTPDTAESSSSSFEVPAFSSERLAFSVPVHVHCEDTSPQGHVRIESLIAFSERVRSLVLQQLVKLTLADLRKKNQAILLTELVVEIVGSGVKVLDTLRIDTTPEFPAPPLFPWATEMFGEDGSLYMRGLFGLNLCQISATGDYSGVDEKAYREFIQDFQKFTNPARAKFSPTNMRFFTAYEPAGKPFMPTSKAEVLYTVRGADCDMYNVLFQARVASMMESCYERYDATAVYINIRQSVRPGDKLAVHVFSGDNSALFVFMKGSTPVLTAFGQYGERRPVSQEGIKCASQKLPAILVYVKGGKKPEPCSDFDFSNV